MPVRLRSKLASKSQPQREVFMGESIAQKEALDILKVNSIRGAKAPKVREPSAEENLALA